MDGSVPLIGVVPSTSAVSYHRFRRKGGLMARPPQRSRSHEIDSRACSIISMLMPFGSWVIRDLTERDFGIDKIAERFDGGDATSELLVIQVKGTEKQIDGSQDISFQLETKTLLYAEMLAIPFLLFRCSIADSGSCYFVWLQEYIRVRLNFENPDWRNQKTNTIHIPRGNRLGKEGADTRLTRIAQFPKLKESWAGYYICLSELMYDFPRHIEEDDLDARYVADVVAPAVERLERASGMTGSIPDDFVPEELASAAELGRRILAGECDEGLARSFFDFVCQCSAVRRSVDRVALRFDDQHMRALFETEGVACY